MLLMSPKKTKQQSRIESVKQVFCETNTSADSAGAGPWTRGLSGTAAPRKRLLLLHAQGGRPSEGDAAMTRPSGVGGAAVRGCCSWTLSEGGPASRRRPL